MNTIGNIMTLMKTGFAWVWYSVGGRGVGAC